MGFLSDISRSNDGVVNTILTMLGFESINFLADKNWALFIICLLRVWQFGSAMVLFLAALKGVFTNIVSETVSYVNAPLLAEQRGIETRMIVEADSPLYRNITILRGTLSDGTVLTVAGTLAGTRMVPKIVGINGYEIEVPIEQHHIVVISRINPNLVSPPERNTPTTSVVLIAWPTTK